jgi:5-methylcytosine-specific restriction endonuclease McrA
MCKLEIELIPKTSFYSNVRSEVTTNEWDVIRKKCYDEASDKCEICGEKGKDQNFNHNVECHEIWSFDVKERIQRLDGFIALCPTCHKSKHFGLSQIKGDEDMDPINLAGFVALAATERIGYRWRVLVW